MLNVPIIIIEQCLFPAHGTRQNSLGKWNKVFPNLISIFSNGLEFSLSQTIKFSSANWLTCFQCEILALLLENVKKLLNGSQTF